MEKWELINSTIDGKAEELCAISDAIWDKPELAFTEENAAKLLSDKLEQEGFAVARNVAGIETAFTGTFGNGKPVIGILGEFDALSGLSQVADCAVKEPLVPGANGHGCGHNLLGVGSLAAAIAVKKYLQETGKEGTVIYYGCPGEEGGAGKAFMAREGAFEGLDCAITWHPSHINSSAPHSSLANMQMKFTFDGIASHAAGAPENGRSALDAVTLMNTGVQFLREHMKMKDRIHYAVTDTGGVSPNVVQAHAEAIYLVRTPHLNTLFPLVERVKNVARGAALMTDTTMNFEIHKITADTVPNATLQHVLRENMVQAGLPEFTDEDYAYAKAMSQSIQLKQEVLPSVVILDENLAETVAAHKDDYLYDFMIPEFPYVVEGSGSTDVGDVSWNTPTAEINTATECAGTSMHTWQATAQGKGPIAHKSMLFAGKALAGGAIDLINDPSLIEAATKEWKRRLNGAEYQKLPAELKPRKAGVKN